jgi:hypothetical protein
MIDYQTENISQKCSDLFETEKLRQSKELSRSILVSHFGYFSQDLVNGFSENVEEYLISSGEKKQIIKRIFSILIEGLQNIRVHGRSDNSGKSYGSFLIGKNDESFQIIFGSLMPADKKNGIEKRIEMLNSLKDDEVKEHYMEVLSNGIISSRGNAGLGLITMRLKSKNKIEAVFHKVSEDFYFFNLFILVEKIQD